MASIPTEPRERRTANPRTNEAPTQLRPSDVVQPTRRNTIPQQASTQPDGGNEVHYTSGSTEPTSSAAKVSFKEQVIGVAKKTRGTLLGKPDVKQHGEMILEGKAMHNDPDTAAS